MQAPMTAPWAYRIALRATRLWITQADTPGLPQVEFGATSVPGFHHRH